MRANVRKHHFTACLAPYNDKLHAGRAQFSRKFSMDVTYHLDSCLLYFSSRFHLVIYTKVHVYSHRKVVMTSELAVVGKMYGTELKVGPGERTAAKIRSRDTFEPIKCSIGPVAWWSENVPLAIGYIQPYRSVTLEWLSLARTVIFAFHWLALILL